MASKRTTEVVGNVGLYHCATGCRLNGWKVMPTAAAHVELHVVIYSHEPPIGVGGARGDTWLSSDSVRIPAGIDGGHRCLASAEHQDPVQSGSEQIDAPQNGVSLMATHRSRSNRPSRPCASRSFLRRFPRADADMTPLRPATGCRQHGSPEPLPLHAASTAPAARTHMEREGRHEALVAGPGESVQGRPATRNASRVAILRIPRLELEVPVYDGTTDAVLDLAAGRIEDTALPGTAGNVGIAAHRDGFFRVLKDLKEGDALVLDTPVATERYQVAWIRITIPTDVSVIAPTPGRAVTLVGCYPFYHVGPAPQRFIVRAVPASGA